MAGSPRTMRYLIYSDLYRYYGRASLLLLMRSIFFGEAGIKFTFWLRVCSCLRGKSVFWFPLYLFSRLQYRRIGIKYGIDISDRTPIGPGFYIGHTGCIVVNPAASIGANCNIHNEVTLGIKNRGRYKGTPTIGDNVYIAPGARIIGNIRVGNGCAIGANAVVTKDLPDNSVAVGVPAKVISSEGSVGYVNRTDYDLILGARINGDTAGQKSL